MFTDTIRKAELNSTSPTVWSGLQFARMLQRKNSTFSAMNCYHAPMCISFLLAFAVLVVEHSSGQTYPGSYPQAEISNGVLRTTVYLPDAEKGFYRGTRFDWAGVIGSLEYKGHSYYGPFFEKFNPAVSDVVIGNPVEAGINSVYYESPMTAHEWQSWRRSLNQFAPLLFQQK